MKNSKKAYRRAITDILRIIILLYLYTKEQCFSGGFMMVRIEQNNTCLQQRLSLGSLGYTKTAAAHEVVVADGAQCVQWP